MDPKYATMQRNVTIENAPVAFENDARTRTAYYGKHTALTAKARHEKSTTR